MAPLTLPARRPATSFFFADENSSPLVKRAKKSPSTTTTTTTTATGGAAGVGRVLLGNITNTHRRVCKSHGKPLIGSSLKKSYLPPPSPSTKSAKAKGKVTVPAISLPSFTTTTSSSSTSSADVGTTGLLGLGLMKDSWIFDIYEDSPEETLQNMMEFSTRALDISDRCILDVGKENIPPEQMPPPPLPSVLPLPVGGKAPVARRRRGVEGGQERSALRELEQEELELFAAGAEEKKVMMTTTTMSMPQQTATTTSTTATTGAKNLKSGWKIWEPDSGSSSMTLMDMSGSQSLSTKGRKRPLEE